MCGNIDRDGKDKLNRSSFADSLTKTTLQKLNGEVEHRGRHLEFFFLNYKRNSTNIENKEQTYFLKTTIYSQL